MAQGRMPTDVSREPLSDHPDLALFVATLFQRLGGSLEIDGQGQRRIRRPDRFAFADRHVPQLADARSHERFHSPAEWEGAIKLAEYWLSRLSGPDKEYVFTLLAPLALDRADGFDFRERL